jgi:hypothetical protein
MMRIFHRPVLNFTYDLIICKAEPVEAAKLDIFFPIALTESDSFFRCFFDELYSYGLLKTLLSSSKRYVAAATLKKNCARSYSTVTKATKPAPAQSKHAIPLSSALRKFYLKVHPDLFAGHPKEQTANENSFKSLTEYLENYKQETESTTPYNLEFHVRLTGEHGQSELKQVNAQLLLPSRHSSAEARAHILKNNLGKLFRQCDYHDDFDVSGYGSSKKLRSAGSNEVSLISVLMAASMRFKGATVGKKSAAQAELDKAKETTRAGNTKLQEQISKAFGVKFAVEVPALYFKSPMDRLKLIRGWLENVKSALDELKVTGHKMELLKDKTITFAFRKQGPVSSASPNTVYLEMKETRSSWVETLRAVNPTADAELVKKLEEISKSELDTAKILGLKKFECSTGIALRHLDAYSTLLQRLHLHATAKPYEWQKLAPNRDRISVRVVDRIDGVFASEISTGTILFPVDRGVTDLHGLLEQNGRQLIAENTELENGLKHIKERYGLSQLAIDPEVPAENVVECLNRLIDGYGILRQYLSGLNICVSNDYAVNEDAKILFVKYDFLF